MKVYNKFVESKKEPSNKNDIWFDGEVFNIYKEGRWQAFTFRVSDAEAVIRIVREFVAYYNDDIKPTVQEAQEAASRIETYVSLAIEATETSTRNNELFIELNAQLAELFNELQSLIDASNTATSSAQEAASLANSQATLAQQATQETIEATVNANNAINTINTLLETLEETINNKVDKIPGKGLSTNDFTDEDKGKLYKLETQIESQDALIKDLQDGKANKEGNYPSLHVGTADTADDLAGRGESVPAEFGFRASGGKSIKDGRAYIKRIKGNSVVWNQLMPKAQTRTHNGVTFTVNDDGSVTATGLASSTAFVIVRASYVTDASHKYFIGGTPNGGTNSTYYFGDGNAMNDVGGKGKIVEGAGTSTSFACRVQGGIEVNKVIYRPKLIDLTKMFGAGNEPTTIEEFNARVATLGVDMNAYNEGQVIHCNTESIKSVGDNAWDEEWEIGRYDTTTGEEIASPIVIRNANYIPVLPNVQYYWHIPSLSKDVYGGYALFYDRNKKFISQSPMGGTAYSKVQTPSNATYMNFYLRQEYGTTYKNDICISLYHSGWKAEVDNTYKPYWQDTLPLPIIRKYFPQGMKSAGTAHDEIRYNKATNKWEAVQRMKAVKMKDLNWSINEYNIFGVVINDMYIAKDNEERKEGILSARYGISERPNVSTEMSDKSILRASRIYLRDTTYSDSASFKASLTDEDILYYELAEPIVTELDAEDQNFRDYYNVADFGTEMSQSSVPSAPFSADIIYQFNAVDMIRENYNEIEKIKAALAKAGITI